MSLQEYLKQRANLMTKNQANPKWHSSGFDEFVLKYGKPMSPSPTQTLRGLPKSCYYNCQELIAQEKEKGLIYVEGYAIPSGLGVPIPLFHAWLINDKGEVIEPTWKQPGVEYWGVPLKIEWVKSIIEVRRQNGHSNVLSIFEGDYLEDFFLLKEGLPKESYVEFP